MQKDADRWSLLTKRSFVSRIEFMRVIDGAKKFASSLPLPRHESTIRVGDGGLIRWREGGEGAMGDLNTSIELNLGGARTGGES
eukprot:scaffold9864_cov124-Isochrysis_galbana.AAC.4